MSLINPMRFTMILILFVPQFALGGACCLDGGPKSFIQLKDLESYQVGVSTSLRDTYGRYDAYGALIRAEKFQTHTLSLGAGMKILDGLDGTLTLPLVYQVKGTGSGDRERADMGDSVVGGRWLLLRSLFRDEWYPSIYFTAGLKMPTGSVESLSDGVLQPGTGNGVWEPHAGFAFQKDYHWAVLGLSATYTNRLQRSVSSSISEAPSTVKEGDRIDLLESATLPLSPRLSLSFGSAQSWELGREIDGKGVADSSTRVVSAFVTSQYFLSRFWSISAGWDFAIPIEKLGVNSPANRTLTVMTSYAFF